MYIPFSIQHFKLINSTIYMWQSRVEIKCYSATYFDRNAALFCWTELPLRVGLICASYIRRCMNIYEAFMSPALNRSSVRQLALQTRQYNQNMWLSLSFLPTTYTVDGGNQPASDFVLREVCWYKSHVRLASSPSFPSTHKQTKMKSWLGGLGDLEWGCECIICDKRHPKYFAF